MIIPNNTVICVPVCPKCGVRLDMGYWDASEVPTTLICSKCGAVDIKNENIQYSKTISNQRFFVMSTPCVLVIGRKEVLVGN